VRPSPPGARIEPRFGGPRCYDRPHAQPAEAGLLPGRDPAGGAPPARPPRRRHAARRVGDLEPAGRERLLRALAFALEAHEGQLRKGTDAPTASHLLQVAGLVLEHGGDADQAAAGLLHDALEDCDGVTREALAERFGPDVARMVEDCSDSLAADRPGQKSDWGLRKRCHLERLAAVGPRSALVAACDKRHNLAALVRDLREEGLVCLERFRAGPAEQLWYFDALLAALGPQIPPRLRQELDGLLAELRALLAVAGRA